MTELVGLLKSLNSVTPLGVIALLVIVIWQLIKKQPASQESVDQIASNHLHDLPEMNATLKRIEEKLESLNNNVIYIKARINGKE